MYFGRSRASSQASSRLRGAEKFPLPPPQLATSVNIIRGRRILRICWETNGAMNRALLRSMADLSIDSGGCIKFDLKAHEPSLHRALCGVDNARTLENFSYLAGRIGEPPVGIDRDQADFVDRTGRVLGNVVDAGQVHVDRHPVLGSGEIKRIHTAASIQNLSLQRADDGVFALLDAKADQADDQGEADRDAEARKRRYAEAEPLFQKTLEIELPKKKKKRHWNTVAMNLFPNRSIKIICLI